MALIVLEGIDGVGKTTAARRLTRLLHENDEREVQVLHRGPPTRHPLEEYELELEAYHPADGLHIICDRWHWGERVYGPIYRKQDQLGRAGQWHVEKFLEARGAVVVHMLLHEDVIRKRLANRGETFLQDHDVSAVLEAYGRVRADSVLEHVVTLLESPDETTLRLIGTSALLHEKVTKPLRDFPTYVGPPKPKVLLLGERRNHPTQAIHRAAFVPYASTSGAYLLNALSQEFVANVGIANACEEDVTALWDTLGYPSVVCLGNDSYHAVNRADVECSIVPHPQYVRRFHNARVAEYAEVIVSAASTTGLDLRKVFT